MLELPLKVPRLHLGSVPSTIPGCPSYLSKQDALPTREYSDAKKARLEADSLAHAIEESTALQREKLKQPKFVSFPEMMERLKGKCIADEWTVIYHPNCATFLHIVNECLPVFQSSVTM